MSETKSEMRKRVMMDLFSKIYDWQEDAAPVTIGVGFTSNNQKVQHGQLVIKSSCSAVLKKVFREIEGIELLSPDHIAVTASLEKEGLVIDVL